MHAFIINLDGADERWSFVSSRFAATGVDFTRVAGVRGGELTLPHPQVRQESFARRHGHRTNHGAIGCYLSHLKCLQAFLDSPHQHAIIAEDDADPVENLREILASAIEFQPTWDLLRLCGFHDPHPQSFASLVGEYQLSVCLTRLCGTGAYMVTRQAADVLLKQLDPMTLPIDHAIDREWVFGLRAAAVMPLPIGQRSQVFASQCGVRENNKYPWYQRYWTVFPFRAWNETSRFVYRRKQLRAARLLAESIAA